MKRQPLRKIPIKKSDDTWCRSDSEISLAFADELEKRFQPFELASREDVEETLAFLDAPSPNALPIQHVSPEEAHHFPSQWKCAVITMIPKPGKPENLVQSYRPISLLPTFSKIFERIFLSRIMGVRSVQDAIPDHQFGFRHHHGTPEQVHRAVQHILDAFENKQYSSAIFLDVKEAFDRVWHDGLLYKLKSLLPTSHFLLLKSYLLDRSFMVEVRGERSRIRMVRAGVPQGSVLGPVLYTLFTSDLPCSNKPGTILATYADDTAFIANAYAQSKRQELPRNSSTLTGNRWNISINGRNSQHCNFTLRGKILPRVELLDITIPQ